MALEITKPCATYDSRKFSPFPISHESKTAGLSLLEEPDGLRLYESSGARIRT